MARPYSPKQPPQLIESRELQEVVRWLADEFAEVAEALRDQQQVLVLPTYVEPTKPVVGEVRWADGTSWNPGGGAGIYEYTGGGVTGWRQLANGTQY